MFDYLIQNGTLIDGTGAPAAAGDVAIKDGKIAAVGDLKDASAGTVLDAAGKYVTPGFIDIHRHADAALFRPFSPNIITLISVAATSLMRRRGALPSAFRRT